MKHQTSEVLDMFRGAGKLGVTNGEFANAGVLSYTSRIAELRKLGFVIAQIHESQGTRRYVLVAEPLADIAGPQQPLPLAVPCAR